MQLNLMLGLMSQKKKNDNFILNWSCVESVEKSLRDIIYADRAQKHWRGRNVQGDIDTLKEFFRKSVGSTWTTAIRRNTTLKVATRSARRPWLDVQDVMNATGDAAPHAYIRRYVLGMTPYFTWCP